VKEGDIGNEETDGEEVEREVETEVEREVERETRREAITETDREIAIGQRPSSVVTSYQDTEGVTVLRTGGKPKINMSFSNKSSILSRIQAFLPELEAANRDMVAGSSAACKLELDDDEALDQPHVEVNLFTVKEHDATTEPKSECQSGDEPPLPSETADHSLIQEI